MEDFRMDTFPQNLLKLREEHNVSRVLMAEILNLRSYTSINDFESGRTLPSLPIFLAVADLFGVNADWLAGRSNIQYSHETLLSLEDILLKEAKTLASTSSESTALGYMRLYVLITLGRTELYTDASIRKFAYTLSERAEIIFCMKIMKYASAVISSVDPNLDLGDINFQTLYERLLPKLEENSDKKAAVFQSFLQILPKSILNFLDSHQRLFFELKERDGKKATTMRQELWENCKEKLYIYGQREHILPSAEIIRIKQLAYEDQLNKS